MDQYSREVIAEKARLRPEDLGLVRTARRSHNQLGLAYQIAFIRLTGRELRRSAGSFMRERGLYENLEAPWRLRFCWSFSRARWRFSLWFLSWGRGRMGRLI